MKQQDSVSCFAASMLHWNDTNEVWNNHHIAQKGFQTLFMLVIVVLIIHSLEVPIGNEAIEYRRQGGSITHPHDFGEDPLASDPNLLQQHQQV